MINTLSTLYAMPTVIIGLVAFLLLSRNGPFGFLGFLFTPGGMIVAQTTLIIPLITDITIAAMSTIEREMRHTIVSQGVSLFQSIWAVLREVKYGVLTAVLIGFGRAIATFVGIENIHRGRVVSRGDLAAVEVAGHTILSKTEPPAGSDEVDVLVRGEDIDLLRQEPAGALLRNRLPCRIAGIELIGPYVRMEVDCTGFSLSVGMAARLAVEREFDTEMEALVTFRLRAVHLLPAKTLRQDGSVAIGILPSFIGHSARRSPCCSRPKQPAQSAIRRHRPAPFGRSSLRRRLGHSGLCLVRRTRHPARSIATTATIIGRLFARTRSGSSPGHPAGGCIPGRGCHRRRCPGGIELEPSNRGEPA